MNNEIKRVLHVAGNMNMGGTETFVMNLYREMVKKGIQFDFVIHGEEGYYIPEIKKLGGRVYKIHDRKKNIILNFMQYFLLLYKNKEYNTIHVHTNSSIVFPTLLIAYVCGIKQRISHSHSTSTKRKRLHMVFRPFLRICSTQLFACSNNAAEWLFGKEKLMKGNVTIINNSINTDLFLFNKHNREIMKKEMELEDKFIIGHIGSFRMPKNHVFLLDIFAEVLKKDDKAVLLLVGTGELMNQIKTKVKKMNIEKNVIFLGNRTDVDKLLQIIDVLVFPSFFEGFPVTLVEAQTSGIKCVVSSSITKEVEITNLIEYVSLDQSPSEWARIIINSKFYNRGSKLEEVKTAGFDIKQTAQKINEFYYLK